MNNIRSMVKRLSSFKIMMCTPKVGYFWRCISSFLFALILTTKRERCILLLSYEVNGIAGFTHKTANGSTTYYYRKNLLGLLRRSMTPRAYAKRSMRMTHGGIAR